MLHAQWLVQFQVFMLQNWQHIAVHFLATGSDIAYTDLMLHTGTHSREFSLGGCLEDVNPILHGAGGGGVESGHADFNCLEL